MNEQSFWLFLFASICFVVGCGFMGGISGLGFGFLIVSMILGVLFFNGL